MGSPDQPCQTRVTESGATVLSNPYPKSGPVRGLLLRIRRGNIEASGRALVSGGRFGDAWEFGTCRWCEQACEANRKWHKDCLKAYSAARGLTVVTNRNTPLTKARGCTCEGDGRYSSIDHILSLGVAREQQCREIRGWWKAWTTKNLQWLCRSCHLSKTREDLRRLRSIRKPTKPTFQGNLF